MRWREREALRNEEAKRLKEETDARAAFTSSAEIDNISSEPIDEIAKTEENFSDPIPEDAELEKAPQDDPVPEKTEKLKSTKGKKKWLK